MVYGAFLMLDCPLVRVRTNFKFLILLAPALCSANSSSCAACHSEIYNKYRQSGMSRSFYQLQPANAIEDFTRKNHYYHPASETFYEMVQRDEKYFQRRYQLGFDGKPTNLDDKQIDFVMGSGTHARTYLHRLTNGSLVQLPLAWYSEKGGYWAMNPGYDTSDHPSARRAIGYDCMFCHNAYPQIPAGQDRYGQQPIYSGLIPEGIDCQRCHGAGDAHIRAAQKGAGSILIRNAILNPARLSSDRQMGVCMQCHLESNSFPLPHAVKRYERSFFSYQPKEPLSAFMLFFDTADRGERDDRFQIVSSAYRLRKSACFLKSNGALGCTTCHDPHVDQHGPDAKAHYNSVCQRCHSPTKLASTRHTGNLDCITCHMQQRRTDDVVHVVMTDHLIRRQPLTRVLFADMNEHHEAEVTNYEGEAVLDYPRHLPATPENRLYMAIAQVRDKSNLNKGIPQLASILTTQHPVNPEPYLELAEALKSAGQLRKAVPLYEESLRRDPQYLPALLQLGTALRELGQKDHAAETLLRATKDVASDGRAWNELGQVYIELGNKPEAAAAFRKAVTLDPEMPEPHNGLAILAAESGDLSGSRAEFQEAIRIHPNYVDAHTNLANLLSWQNMVTEAAFEFKKAILLRPADAMLHFNYGTMLNGQRQFEEAQRQLEAAVTANPNLAEAHDLLGNLAERQGRLDDALREYRRAVQIQPDLSRAQLDLGATLARQGDKQGAAEHLKLAAKTVDPTLRNMALQLLAELGS